MTTFGSKEPWMDRMNIFIGSSKAEFRSFIDQICSVPLKAPAKAVSPSYATPIQMLGRLPATSREGFPSLPYLIDSAQRFANLVSLWLGHFPASKFENEVMQQPLHDFHHTCLEIHQLTSNAVQSAGSQHLPDKTLDRKSDLIAEEVTHAVTQANGVPTRPPRPSTGTTSSSNGLRISHTRNGNSLDGRSPLGQQDSVDPANNNTTSSSASTTFDRSRIPSSRSNMSDGQGSSTSKTSPSISFHRPLIPRNRPLYGSQDTS
jgi:hypothetical protein